MYYLKTEHHFDAAHFLYGYDGKCKNIHGHHWRVVAKIKCDDLSTQKQTRGMLIDFGDLKTAVRTLCDSFDHALIYEKGSLKENTLQALRDEDFHLIEIDFRPTAENFARYIFMTLKDQGLPMHRIEVYETPTNCAIYEE